MQDLDDLFGRIQSTKKDEEEGRWSYVVLKDVVDPQFNVRTHFPQSTGHSRKYIGQADSAVYYVHFKTPAEAEEASKKTIKGVKIVLPTQKKRQRGERKEKKEKAAGTVPPTKEKKKKVHGWKLVKDIKILIRRHIKSLKEKSTSVTGNLKASATYAREIKFLEAALRFLHTGSDILGDEADYFLNYDEGGEINFIKKARISLETQVQERVTCIKQILQANKDESTKQIAMKKLKKSYYCTEMLLQYLKGEKEPKAHKSVLELVDIKEEEDSEDDQKSEESEEEAGDDDDDEESHPSPAKKPKASIKNKEGPVVPSVKETTTTKKIPAKKPNKGNGRYFKL